MIPPSFLAPDTSTCWNWYIPPENKVIPIGADSPQKGCDYQPCRDAVCACDPYCCDVAWDISCRGYEIVPGDIDLVNKCSAKILCCEQESANPDPPVGGVLPIPETTLTSTWIACDVGVDSNCCATMNPPSLFVPNDSSCWQWYTPPPDGRVPAGAPPPPTGCDYKPCQDAVCACDDYCCSSAWDLSCRGYVRAGNTIENNYFVEGCSAKILCCEQASANPDFVVGVNSSSQDIGSTSVSITRYIYNRKKNKNFVDHGNLRHHGN